MDSINKYLSNYYGNYDENGRLERKYGQVEFLTTMLYIEKYLTPTANIIEIGAGTGQYSKTIAEMGFTVESVELLQCNIDIFKENLNPQHNIRISQGNALDLSAFNDECFDITLLLGPMYHLYTVEDKKQALSEALRVTKTGGVLFVAYCISDGSIVLSGFKRKVFNIEEYIKLGKINPETFDTFSLPKDIFELVRKEDIDELISNFSVERLHYVSTDLFTCYIADTINEMNDDEFSLYLKYHFSICERTDMLGISHHSLDILKKI